MLMHTGRGYANFVSARCSMTRRVGNIIAERTISVIRSAATKTADANTNSNRSTNITNSRKSRKIFWRYPMDSIFLVPPKWTVEPIDQSAVVGHGVSIACQAEGFPIPTVTWKQSIGKSRLLEEVESLAWEEEDSFTGFLYRYYEKRNALPVVTRTSARARAAGKETGRNENVRSHLINVNNKRLTIAKSTQLFAFCLN